MLILLPLALFLLQVQETELPYKPNEEYRLEVDFKFKTQPVNEHLAVDFSETRAEHDKRTGGPLPYLILHITPFAFSEGEERVKVFDKNKKVLHAMKVKLNIPFDLDLGFTDDMKDAVTPSEFNIVFISRDKKEVNRIHMIVQEDGTFMVNGEMRGKF